MLHGHFLNPAATGSNGNIEAAALYRHQWMAMPNAPRTAVGSFQAKLEDYNMGAGGYFIFDKTGPTSFMGLYGNYAYQIELGASNYVDSKIAFGLQLGLVQYRLAGDELRVNDPSDELVLRNNDSKIRPDAGAGIYYFSDFFRFGVAVPQLMSMNISYEDDGRISGIDREMHVFLMGGGMIPFNDEGNFIEPSLFVKYSPVSPIHAQLDIRARFYNGFNAGIGYATDRTISANAGILFQDQYRITYGVSFQFSENSQNLGMTHEFGLIYIIESEDWYY